MATSALALALVLTLVGCNPATADGDAPPGAAAVAALAATANMLSVRALQVFSAAFLGFVGPRRKHCIAAPHTEPTGFFGQTRGQERQLEKRGP
eukprot:scaffold19408_cov57-Phaeocystis_antarctica.AAC.2